MSNLRSTGHIHLKTSMSNKWKSQAPNSEMLERQTRALEESLNKLKLAIHPEKNKATTETSAPIWDKGKTGPLSQYASHVLRDEPKRNVDANKPTKFRVLTDEPPATIVRPSLVANMLSSKPASSGTTTTANKITKCGQCERDDAKMKCLECAESYCATCFAHFHLRGALQRHRCVPLTESRPATPQKKKPPVGADVIFKELRFAQSKDDFLRKSIATTDNFDYQDDDMQSEEGTGGELLTGHYDEKASAASFQQALLEWRQGGNRKKATLTKNNRTKKSKTTTQEAAVDTVYDTNTKLNQINMPKIEFHSSKLTYAEKLLLKKYRRTNQNHKEFFEQRPPSTDRTPRGQLKAIENIHVDRSFPHNIEIEPLYDNPSTERTEQTARITPIEENHTDINNEEEDEELMRLKQQEEERAKSRASTRPTPRPRSSMSKKNAASSRPSSAARFQHPLPSLLAADPSNELKAIVDSQPITPRPSSAALKKATKPDYRLPTMWNRNWKPEQCNADDIDMKLVKIDYQAIEQFDAVLNDLLDETKIENDSQRNTQDATPRPSSVLKPSITSRSEKERIANSPTPRPSSTLKSSITSRSEKERIENSPTPRPSSTLKSSITSRSEKERIENSPTPRPSSTLKSSITSRSEKERIANSPTPRPSSTLKSSITSRSEKESIANSPTPRRISPFNFNDTPRKMDSSSSVDTGDGGFFTDVKPHKALKSPIPQTQSNERPPSSTPRSTHVSIEQQRPTIPNLASLRKTSIENLARAPPKRSITLEEAHQQLDDQSRPTSSLSSASLPVSITSSKPDIITRPSIERYPKAPHHQHPPPPSTITTTKKFRVEYPKKSPPPTVVPMVIEGKKVTSARNSARGSDDHLQQSTTSIRSKIPSGVQRSQNIVKTSSTSSMTSITRDDNILRDESMTITDVPLNKSINRHSTNIDREPTKSRRMEFSVRTGLKWNQASSKSTSLKVANSSELRRSAKLSTSRPLTPSNPTNTKMALQFSVYDNDDGRSSRAFQDIEDAECFNQLREELCSELDMASPGWDASLGDHVLKNLRALEVPFNEKDLQDNLATLEVKLREAETLQRAQTDDDISIHEEIRNL